MARWRSGKGDLKMETMVVCEKTLPQAYHEALAALYFSGKECTMLINIEEPLCEPMISVCGMYTPESLEQYRQEILDGILDFEADTEKWDYTYHQRMAAWKSDVVRILKKTPESRRAEIGIRDNAKDMHSDNPACLQLLQYMIRDGKLHCWAVMRSNDAVRASFMNMFAFIMLQKEFADKLGVEVGEYTHFATNYHVYEGEEEKELKKYVMKYLANRKDSDSLAIPYVGCWDALMEAEKPKIAEKVADQYKKYLAKKKCCANCGRKGCKVSVCGGDQYELSCYDFIPKGVE